MTRKEVQSVKDRPWSGYPRSGSCACRSGERTSCESRCTFESRKDRAAREEGMTFLRESAVEKVRFGVTTLKEINKVTFIE